MKLRDTRVAILAEADYEDMELQYPLYRMKEEGAQVTVKAAAEALEWSPVKIWRIESGQTSMRSLDVEAMCKVYGAADDVTSALTSLATGLRTHELMSNCPRPLEPPIPAAA